MLRHLFAIIALFWALALNSSEKFNFNHSWLLHVGDTADGASLTLNDNDWERINLPHAFNGNEAFSRAINELTDTVMWYRKHFPNPLKGGMRKAFIEFEGIRQGGDFYINGHHLGTHENGVMASGWDLTPYLNDGDNVIAVRIDNDWDYKERSTGTTFQWNDRNFNANYGGIPKNVFLHIAPEIYQTLPLYSNLGTTGIYIYGTDFDIPRRRATVNVESEVKNDSPCEANLSCRVTVTEPDGSSLATFTGNPHAVKPGAKTTLTASATVDGLNFWSWGYGYLYDITTEIIDSDGRVVDSATTRTGFRKTGFDNGKIRLNDKVIQMHGYAQRTSNEWPATGVSIPAWLSDYSNGLMIESGANIVRWMHVTPWRQDVESCDRIGLMQAMPAGDAEKDIEGRRWEQRIELMRDAIIYNRNSPSVIFYEAGNHGISREHMLEMIALRDSLDPHGGRAMGCREMLDIEEAEYGGEMLYINRSGTHPVWAMEYCRDEGLRKYWDDYSYPFHKEGDGPLYRGKDASEYNHNQDNFAIEMVRRWYDYWIERPGSGDKCSSGGVKIVFSDTNTHFRGKENYRRSGVVDAMRIPKDAFYAHQVMWGDTWVDNETHRNHIIGHWNYSDTTVKPVYVVSTSPAVELTLNGKSLGFGKKSHHFLFTFPGIRFEPGTLTAIGRDTIGNELCRHSVTTAGRPSSLLLTPIINPEGFHADGADMALVQVEVVDSAGNRCPLDNRTIHFTITGPARWLGGIAQGKDNNFVGDTSLPVECGINRVILQSDTIPGAITIIAEAEGMEPALISLSTSPAQVSGGLSSYLPSSTLPCRLQLGPTGSSPSYSDRLRSLKIASAKAGSNNETTILSFDNNEKSLWSSAKDNKEGGWITYQLEEPSTVDEITLKLAGWRNTTYPLEIYADSTLIWKGVTPKSLGYVHITPSKKISASSVTLKLSGDADTSSGFTTTELAGGQANSLDSASKSNSGTLRIVEIEFFNRLSEE